MSTAGDVRTVLSLQVIDRRFSDPMFAIGIQVARVHWFATQRRADRSCSIEVECESRSGSDQQLTIGQVIYSGSEDTFALDDVSPDNFASSFATALANRFSSAAIS